MNNEYQQPSSDQPNIPNQPGQPRQSPSPGPTGGSIDNEKLLAIGSYASIFLGLPLFIIPLAMRDSELALYHAKQATVVFCMQLILVFVMMFVGFITFGLGFFLFPIVFLPWIPAIHGMIIASRGEMSEPMMLFGIAAKIFKS